MRILLSCQQSLKTHAIPAYAFWEGYFKRGIEEAGHQWLEVPGIDWAEGLTYSPGDQLNRWRSRTWETLLAFVRREHASDAIDAFLSYLFPQQVEAAAITELRRLEIPCVNFFCDNVRQFVRVPEQFHCFDLHWVPEHKAIRMYRESGLNCVQAPMPAWVPPEQRSCQHFEKYGVSFVGSRDSQRAHLFAEAIKRGAKLEIRGAGWAYGNASDISTLPRKQTRHALANQWQDINNSGLYWWVRKLCAKAQPEIPSAVFDGYIRQKPNELKYVEITQQSLITLGVSRYPSFRHPFSRPDTYSRLRDLEAPMMGACYLTEWTEGLNDMYELGEEIETYRTAEEMVEKIKILSSDAGKRKKMRYQGQRRALTEHTVARSLTKIRKALGVCK